MLIFITMDLLIRRLNPSSSVPQPLRRVCDMLASYLTSHKCRGIMGYVSHLLSPGYVRAGYTRPHPTHIRDTQRTFWGRINRNMSLHFLKGRDGVLEFETAVSPLSAAALTNLHSLSIAAENPPVLENSLYVRKTLPTLSPALSFLAGRWVDFGTDYVPASPGRPRSTRLRNVQFVHEADISLFFAPLLLRKLPGPSLQFHSTSFNFLTGRGGGGWGGASLSDRLVLLANHPSVQLPPIGLHQLTKSPGKFGSVISGEARTRLCRNNPSSPPGG